MTKIPPKTQKMTKIPPKPKKRPTFTILPHELLCLCSLDSEISFFFWPKTLPVVLTAFSDTTKNRVYSRVYKPSLCIIAIAPSGFIAAVKVQTYSYVFGKRDYRPTLSYVYNRGYSFRPIVSSNVVEKRVYSRVFLKRNSRHVEAAFTQTQLYKCLSYVY